MSSDEHAPESPPTPWPEAEEDNRIQQRVAQVSRLFQRDLSVQALLEVLAEAVVVIDQVGVIVYINRRTQELFGYEPAELIGRPLRLLLPERFTRVHARHLVDYFATPHHRSIGLGLDLVGKRKEGAEIPVEISLSYLHTEAGPLALASITDISRRKQIEQALQQRNEDLDAFAHTVAHDLNAQLAVIVGFSEELADAHPGLPPDELRRYLLTIARSGRKMSNIINDLLLFASMRKEDVVLTTLDMKSIVAEALQRVRPLIEEYRAEVLAPDSFPAAAGHAPWVEEVWFNYLSNALKYGGRPPRLEIGGTQQADGRVSFWVKDNGAGLTAQQQAQLFEPLTQFERPKITGHGLGLSIVRRIVEKIGGQVRVESTPGQGSTFYFTLWGVEANAQT